MTDLTFTDNEMKNLHPSIKKEVIDYMNSNNGDTDQPRTFKDGMTYFDYVRWNFDEWIEKRCGNWNPLEHLQHTTIMDEVGEFCEYNETLNNLTSIITNKTLDEDCLEDVFNWIFNGYEMDEIFVGYNHLYEYVESYIDKNIEWGYESDIFFHIVDIINENGGLETFNSLKSVDEIVIHCEKRELEPSVGCSTNYRFDFNDDKWLNHSGLSYKSEWCSYDGMITYELLGSLFIWDTCLTYSPLEYLSNSLVEKWDEVIKEIDDVKQYIKTFEVEIIYNGYGGTHPVYRFSLFDDYKDKLEEVLDKLTSIDLFCILQEEIGVIGNCDVGFISQILEEDKNELEWCLTRYIESHIEVGYEIPTNEELKDGLEGWSFSDEDKNLITDTYSSVLQKFNTKTLEVV